MVTTFVTHVASNLGTVAVVYQISRKDKFPKKMYMGVCSVESIRIRKIMRVFPIRDSKYTVRNITNNASCSAEEPGNPRKMNSATAVLLVPSIVHHRSGGIASCQVVVGG